MSKYYNVNLYKVTIDWEMEKEEELVGNCIVKKGLIFAKGLDGKRYRIVNSDYLEHDFFDYTQEELDQLYPYYLDYEEQTGDLYQYDPFIFKEKLVVKREELTSENEVSPLELQNIQSGTLTTKQKVKSMIKNKLKK